MRCGEAARQLQLYIDRRLTVEQVRVLESHIADCRACQRDLYLLEEIATFVRDVAPIAEPADLTTRIMRQVAITPQRPKERSFVFWRPSLPELLAVVLLATISTLGVMWQQPSLRAVLPFANGRDLLSLTFFNLLHSLSDGNTALLLLALWIVGAAIGVCITLILAGSELRAQWFKAMLERLPVR
ncbi:MAG TPA: zf-HC2 domain-containing protein [Ktedonobacteraceae bacterium]|nr:zf-HC2 domain-containing protein [Ktedonobacteraceae bacterium]